MAMNWSFDLEEDFDFSDDDSLAGNFFAQSNDVNQGLPSPCSKSKTEKQILEPLSNKKSPKREFSALVQHSKEQEQNHHGVKLSMESQGFQMNKFLQNGLKRKADLIATSSSILPSYGNDRNFKISIDDDNFEIPSDDSFDENEVDFNLGSLKNNADCRDVNKNNGQFSFTSRTQPSFTYKQVFDKNSAVTGWSVNDNHTISKRAMDRSLPCLPSKSQFDKSDSGSLKSSFKTPDQCQRISKTNKFRTPDSGFSSLKNSIKNSLTHASQSSYNSKLIKPDLKNMHCPSADTDPEEDCHSRENDSHVKNGSKENDINDNEVQFAIEKKRKFPGPAGLLPKLSSPADISNLVLPSPQSAKKLAKTPKSILSPAFLNIREDDDFNKPLWFNLQKQTNESCKGLENYTISTIIRKAGQNQLEKGKVPLFYSLIKVFSLNGSDASIVLKDPTGEIHGTVHKRVLENYQSELCPGSGIILKQVSIFSPTAKKHYVNITPSNIILLLPAEQVSSSQASQISQRESHRTSFSLAQNSKIPDQTDKLDISRQQSKNHLENLFAEEENLNSLLDDSDFLEGIPAGICN